MLRRLVRKLILEIYELSPEDEEQFSKLDKMDQLSPDVRRAVGLQNKEDIMDDRNVLKDYQRKLREHPDGKAMIEDFRKGNISICHSLLYEGAAMELGLKDRPEDPRDHKPFTDWLRKYGKNSKDTLSCIAFNSRIGDTPTDFGINIEAFEHSIGFYMKGYPTYVCQYDIMSQTLGALPSGLVKHQKHSGIAKRAGNRGRKGEIYGVDWEWAGEVLLDNWRPVGIFIDVANAAIDYSEYALRDLMEDALKTGLPLYMFDGMDTSYGRVDDIDSFVYEHGGLY